MANQTVYPYGTGGSLPSSIGVINDPFTGGADKAWSAEQGKEIYADVHEMSPINISLFSEVGAFIADTDKWAVNYQTYKGKFIPVLPGETYIVKGNATHASFIAVLTTNAYSNNAQVSYASDSGRQTLGIGASVVLTIPDDGHYLYVSTYSTYDVAPQSVTRLESRFDAENDRILSVGFDLDSFAQVRAYPAETNKWVTDRDAYPYYGIFIPCEAGKKYAIVAKTATNVAYFCFLTSSAHTHDSSVSYASGYSGAAKQTPTGGGVVTAPDDAQYLYVVTTFTGFETSIAPSRVAEIMDTAEGVSEEVVERALSESGEIPIGLTKVAYNGAPVRLNNQHYVATDRVAAITAIAGQGGACYGNYLFMFKANNTTCWIYDLATNTLIQTITIPEEERGFVTNCHCNTVNFGTEKYDAGDPFPLIYVSTGYNDGTNSGALVYRIVATTENDVTTFSLTLVQTLKMPTTWWTEFVVGDDGDCYLCYTAQEIIYRMKMPTLAQGDVTFDLEQALDVYKFTDQPAWHNNSSGQGRIYNDGRIYFVSGEPSKGHALLFVALDLATGRRVVEINLSSLGLTSEPEALFVWNGHFCVAFANNANVYALYFE